MNLPRITARVDFKGLHEMSGVADRIMSAIVPAIPEPLKPEGAFGPRTDQYPI